MRRLLVASVLIFTSLNAQAALTITSISGVSSATIVPATTAPTTPGGTTTPAQGTASASAMGGVAGYSDLTNTAPSCAVMDGINPCNSCLTAVCQDDAATPKTLTPLCACNRARIYDNLGITVAITQATTPLFNVRAASGGTAGTAGTGTEILADAAYNTGAVTFKWSKVCALIQGGTGTGTCEGVNGSAVVTIYVDKDNSQTFTTGDDSIQVTFRVVSPSSVSENVYGDSAKEGIGDFLPYPGDDRIYLKDVNTVTTFPALSYGINIASVKMFLSDKNLDSANAVTTFDPEGSLDVPSGAADINDGFLDGVHNGTTYFVRLAMQDQAGNIIQYFPDALGTDAKGNPHPECFGAAATSACPFAVVPDPVLGILSKDFNCFIASAAYGTSLEPKLDLFRKFRSDVLLRHNWGRKFVMEYYTYGPYAARFIADKPLVRWMVRGALWPLAGYSWLALKIGLVKSLILSLLLLSVLIAPAAFGLRRYSRRA